ncbi:MAG: XRE family transcriptional regulator [Clostridia bacterium]|nr:XRE family transcriptional regulator [Clostridia bacterium]
MFDMKAFAENMHKYRLKSGIKQRELADKMYISPQSVSKWEQGQSMPNVQNLCLLAEILGVSIDELLNHKSQKERLMIAIDGGGTKTEFVLISEKGNIKKRLVLSGSNPNIYEKERCCEILKTGIDSLMFSKDDVVGIYCGMAGYASGNNAEIIDTFLKNQYPDIRIECRSDIFNVAASATRGKRSIAAICGTGSNVCIIEGKSLHRVGGWGYLFDNKGSGFDIGRDAIATTLAENDGIGPKTLLTELIEDRLGMNIWDSITRLYTEDKSFIASFAVEVFKAYQMGDAVAAEIMVSNANAFADRVNFAAAKYAYSGDVVISGGIVSKNSPYFKLIKEQLNKNLCLITPNLPPIYGACVLCFELCGIPSEKLEENFASDYEKETNNAEN